MKFMRILCLTMILTIVVTAAADTIVHWQVVSAGGTNATAGSYQLKGTAVQTAIGETQSQNFRVRQGFWQNFGPPCLVGDADGNGQTSIADAVFLINYIFSGGPAPVSLCAGDADGSGNISIADVVALINYIFRS